MKVKGRPNLSGPCGCMHREWPRYEIELCPLHAAAEEMRDYLKDLLEIISDEAPCPPACACSVQGARALLAKVERR